MGLATPGALLDCGPFQNARRLVRRKGRKTMKSIAKYYLTLTAAAVIVSLPAQAQVTNNASTNNTITNSVDGSRRAVRPGFRGTVSSVDSDGMVVNLRTRSGVDFKVKVTSRTRITKDGQPATFSDIAEKLTLSGQGTKDAEGNWDATVLRIITRKPRPEPAPADAAK
jgi:hypothetical protein